MGDFFFWFLFLLSIVNNFSVFTFHYKKMSYYFCCFSNQLIDRAQKTNKFYLKTNHLKEFGSTFD